MNPFVHAMLGMLVAALLEPGSAAIALSGYLGGLFPDLDALVGKHRRTLHFPWIFTLTGVVFFMIPLPVSLVASVFLLAAGVHSLSDFLAGGELRSWKDDERSKKGTYDHVRQKWVEPLRLVYGPSSRESVLATVVGIILMFQYSQMAFRVLILASLAFTYLYLLTVRYMDEVPEEYDEINLYIRSCIRRYLPE